MGTKQETTVITTGAISLPIWKQIKSVTYMHTELHKYQSVLICQRNKLCGGAGALQLYK